MNQDLIEFEANFSVLDRYGTYVTKEEYITDPAIGRDQQIKELILVLLTPEKSAILIGKPGIGKTAIVEGLAYRIQQNDVPEALKGYEIINIKTASLLGTMPSGESKVQKMIDELKTKEKLILFIDEVHMLIGATDSSSLDFANIFKEGLGRGSIKVIGATTTEEYERYILRDKAFTRRFQKIDVPEPSRDETIKIMIGTLPKFEKQTGRKMKYTPFIQERIMSFIVDLTSEYKRVYALGSRYPDVCLTLLKQAFSYTVYDDRQYMDIFDVRKAIENSKNIYPDVIKKELPNFDKMFNDIILEEKGEKPIEEWRKDSTPLRVDIDPSNVQSMESNTASLNPNIRGKKSTDATLSMLENAPEIINREDLKNLDITKSSRGKKKYAKIGSTSVSTGFKEKMRRNNNTSAIDELLTSNSMGVLSKKETKDSFMPTTFVETEEIKKGVSDSVLLGKPILSTLDNDEEDDAGGQQVGLYRIQGNKRRKKNEGKAMWNDGNRPERQDISNQNFDKYNNFFHQDSGFQNNGYGNPMNNSYGNNSNFMGNPPMDKNEQLENQKRMDMLMGVTRPNNGNNQMNNGMNQGMGMPQNNMGPMPGGMNPGMGMPQNNMGPMPGGMNPGMGMPQNNMGPMPSGMNPGMGMPQNNMGPMNNGMNPRGPMQPNLAPNANNNKLPPPLKKEEKKEETKKDKIETLFGAPMYGTNKEEDKFDDIPDIYAPDPIKQAPPFPNNNMNNRMGPPSMAPQGMAPPNMAPPGMFGPMPPPNMRPPQLQPTEQPKEEYKGETLFGAPMYSNDEEPKTEPQNQSNDNIDIFGQLITDNMRIKNGKIVDDLPTFEKLNNLSNTQTYISDVREVSQNNDKDKNLIPNLETGAGAKLFPQNNMNQNMMNQGMGMNPNMMNQQMGIPNMMNQGMGMNPNMMNQQMGMPNVMNQGMGMNPNMMNQQMGMPNMMNQGMGMNPNMMNQQMGMNPNMMNQRMGMPQNNMGPMPGGMMPQMGMPQNNMGPMNNGMNQGMGMPQGNRNWTFLDSNQYTNQVAVMPEQPAFQTNILDIAKAKKESKIASTPNNTEPTNNKDYYEDMKSGEFADMNDLKNGQIKEEDANKYMGVQTEEDKPQYDLNLESDSKKEEEFDDFFE